jgi:D-sedoheptulose 7-phosphate isomerase
LPGNGELTRPPGAILFIEIVEATGLQMRTTRSRRTRTKVVNEIPSHTEQYFAQTQAIARSIDKTRIESLATGLARVRRRGGRLFLLGAGGGAANCAHAVNDFRKLCDIEAYAPTDNVAELTARINDDGWDGVFAAWLRVSRLGPKDAVMVLSVGGGDRKRGVSVNLIQAIDYARKRRALVFGIVGRDGGYTSRNGDIVVVIPTVDASLVTPHSEAFQAVVWHCLVSHPKLQRQPTKW